MEVRLVGACRALRLVPWQHLEQYGRQGSPKFRVRDLLSEHVQNRTTKNGGNEM